MEKLVIYRKDVVNEEIFIPSWYCKPSILRSVAYCLSKKENGCLFVSCSKYGCQQFTPEQSKSFHVSELGIFRLGSVNCLVPVFGS